MNIATHLEHKKKNIWQNFITTLNSFPVRFCASRYKTELTVTGESTLWTLLSSTRISLKTQKQRCLSVIWGFHPRVFSSIQSTAPYWTVALRTKTGFCARATGPGTATVFICCVSLAFQSSVQKRLLRNITTDCCTQPSSLFEPD